MECRSAREALSARLDGELPAALAPALDAHLAGCAACRRHGDALGAATRRQRLHVAPSVPDLSDRVAVAAATPELRPSWSPARTGLVLLGVVQLLLSLPALVLGDDVAASLHVAREVGVTDIALAVGVLSAAWRPWRAAGMLPVVAVLAIGLFATSALDVVQGRVDASGEVVHLLALADFLLLWQLRHRDPLVGPARPARRDERPGLREAG